VVGDSTGGEEAGDLRDGLAVLEAVGEHAQGQHLCLRERLLPGRPVREHAGEGDHLGDPTAVRLALQLDHELGGGHGRSIPAASHGRGRRPIGGSYRATLTTFSARGMWAR